MPSHTRFSVNAHCAAVSYPLHTPSPASSTPCSPCCICAACLRALYAHGTLPRLSFASHACSAPPRSHVLKFNWQRFLLALISLRLLCLHTRTLLPFPSLLLQSIFVPGISLLCPVQCRTYTRFFTRNRLHYLVLSKSTN